MKITNNIESKKLNRLANRTKKRTVFVKQFGGQIVKKENNFDYNKRIETFMKRVEKFLKEPKNIDFNHKNTKWFKRYLSFLKKT